MKPTFLRKNYRLNLGKLRKAQKWLRTKTETETIHRALDLAADEAALAKALKELLDKGRGHIGDASSRRAVRSFSTATFTSTLFAEDQRATNTAF